MASKRGMRLEIEKVEMKGNNTVGESAGSWGLTAVVGLDNSRVSSYMVADCTRFPKRLLRRNSYRLS